MALFNPNQPPNQGQTLGSLPGWTPPGAPRPSAGGPQPGAGGLPSQGGQPAGGGVRPFWQTSPWLSQVTASLNGSPVNFASPGKPNPNYITPEAAKQLGQLFGANVVSQNMTGMASPGSGTPSSPMYGLDFGDGNVQDAGMGAVQLERGDSPELVRQRYEAGRTTKAWTGAPAPGPSPDWQWNFGNPVAVNVPAGKATNPRSASTSAPAGTANGMAGQDPSAVLQMLAQLFGM